MRIGGRTSTVSGSPRCRPRQDHEVCHRLRTWASPGDREFEVELVKKLLGQPADLSRQTARRTDSSHVKCVSTLMIECSHLCWAPICHQDVQYCTKKSLPVLCKDKTKLLLEMRQWLSDPKELQAVRSPLPKETVMQSLNTVAGQYQRSQQVTDSPVPNHPRKLWSVIELKVAGWGRDGG